MAQSPGIVSQAANALGCEEVISPTAPGDSLGAGPGGCVTYISLSPHHGDPASL